MRLILPFCFLLLFSCKNNSKTVLSKESTPPTLTDLTFEKKVLDFGSVNQGDTVKAVFKFKNIGDDTLNIEYVNPECTCTSFYLTKNPIVPNDSASVVLVLDTSHKSGLQKISAVVKANTKAKFYRIMMKANVL